MITSCNQDLQARLAVTQEILQDTKHELELQQPHWQSACQVVTALSICLAIIVVQWRRR